MASGMRNMKMPLIYEIGKCPFEEKEAGRAVETDSSSFFAAPLPTLCRDFTNLRSSLVLHSWGMLTKQSGRPCIFADSA